MQNEKPETSYVFTNLANSISSMPIGVPNGINQLEGAFIRKLFLYFINWHTEDKDNKKEEMFKFMRSILSDNSFDSDLELFKFKFPMPSGPDSKLILFTPVDFDTDVDIDADKEDIDIYDIDNNNYGEFVCPNCGMPLKPISDKHLLVMSKRLGDDGPLVFNLEIALHMIGKHGYLFPSSLSKLNKFIYYSLKTGIEYVTPLTSKTKEELIEMLNAKDRLIAELNTTLEASRKKNDNKTIKDLKQEISIAKVSQDILEATDEATDTTTTRVAVTKKPKTVIRSHHKK